MFLRKLTFEHVSFLFFREAIESMMKVGDVNTRLKELEVALELSELSRQHAEKEASLAKEKAETSVLEIKQLEQMVIAYTKFLFLLSKFHLWSHTSHDVVLSCVP